MRSATVLVCVTSFWALLTSAWCDNVAIDKSVCYPRELPTEATPPPILGDIWVTEIEWKDLLHNRSYVTKDYADIPNQREAVIISPPYHADIKLFFNFFTDDVMVEQLGNDGKCYVSRGQPGKMFAYQDHFWLTSFNTLFQHFSSSRDAVLVGMTTIRGVRASNWSACLFDFTRNLTLSTNMYFSDVSWMSPYQMPRSMAPLRVEYWGRQTNGSVVTEYKVQGDLGYFQKSPTIPPDVFVTDPGQFCPNRTGESMRLPEFPARFSLLREKVDVDFKRIVYEELWYDRTLRMVRWDSKAAVGRDDDEISYIFDFNANVKYIIDRHLMQCDPPTPMMQGDDFTMAYPNGTLDLMTTAAYFLSENADIQYVGQVTVRDVMCDTWIGRFFDQDANRIKTVQWFFTASPWMEATGSVEGTGAFFRMEVWSGGSQNPTIYNVMRYNPSAPDVGEFDFSVCYGFSQKKHFTAEFKVLNSAKFPLLSGLYLKQQVMTQLSSRLQIQPNRFTDLSFDFSDDGNNTGTLYMTGTLLERATGAGKPLQGVFDFMVGSIAASNFQIFLADPQDEPVPLEGVNVVEHVYTREFTTTSTPVPTTTIFVVPTRVPHPLSTTSRAPDVPPLPGQTTTSSSACPPFLPCSCPAPRSCPTQTCPPPTPCSCPHGKSTPCLTQPTATCQPGNVPCTCPPLSCPTQTCPPPTPCTCSQGTSAPCPSQHTVTCQPGNAPCTCPPTPPPATCPPCSTAAPTTPCTCPSQRPCGGQLGGQGSVTETGISVGALVGGVISALLFGLIIGFVATRFYHVLRGDRKPMTINLIDNDFNDLDS